MQRNMSNHVASNESKHTFRFLAGTIIAIGDVMLALMTFASPRSDVLKMPVFPIRLLGVTAVLALIVACMLPLKAKSRAMVAVLLVLATSLVVIAGTWSEARNVQRTERAHPDCILQLSVAIELGTADDLAIAQAWSHLLDIKSVLIAANCDNERKARLRPKFRTACLKVLTETLTHWDELHVDTLTVHEMQEMVPLAAWFVAGADTATSDDLDNRVKSISDAWNQRDRESFASWLNTNAR